MCTTHSRDTERALHLHNNTVPASFAEWGLHFHVCQTVLRFAEQGLRAPYESHTFYVPPTVAYLLSVWESGLVLLSLMRIIKDLYLVRSIPPMYNWEGQLSDLDTEGNIICELTKQICEVIHLNDDQVQCLLRDLHQDLENLQYPGLYMSPPTGDGTADAVEAIAASDVYFLACAFHPEFDVDGTRAAWYRDFLACQPHFLDRHTQHCRNPIFNDRVRLPELVYLLRSSMLSGGDDFVRVFEVFGRWSLTALKHIVRATVEHLRNPFPFEADFVRDTTSNLESCWSPIPLQVRQIFTHICLRHTYREMLQEADRVYSRLGGDSRPDFFSHEMFKWIIDCVLDSSLEPEYKNRISTWMRNSGLDQVLTSDGPTGLVIPGQRVLSRLMLPHSSADQALNAEILLEYEDVESVLCGPDLRPLCYATAVTNNSRPDSDICSICIENLANDPEQVLIIRICGHLVHHGCLDELINDIQPWSNKCPVCRQQICPPRAKRALTSGEEQALDEEDEEQDLQDEEQEGSGFETDVEE